MVIATDTAVDAVIEQAPLEEIDANPFRRLGKYPYVESKIESLTRSIAEVGLWESIIARRRDNRLQIAFAHHRVEAARRLKLSRIPVIVRDLSDEQMLMFMGRENGVDYNADFLCLLETWEAGAEFIGGNPGRFKIASLLGWTRLRDGRGEVANDIADACDDAYRLIKDGHFDRKNFIGMAVSAVREIVQTVLARHEKIEKVASEFKWDQSKVKTAKSASTHAGKEAAKEVKAGTLAHRDIKSKADEHFVRHPAVRREVKLLNMAIQPLIKRVQGTLERDSDGKKIDELIELLPGVVHDLNEYDEGALDALSLALSHLSKRAATKSHGVDRKKVVALPVNKRLNLASPKRG